MDTIFDNKVDTLTLIKDNLIIQYRRIGNKIQLAGHVKSDTIIREKKIMVDVPIYVERSAWWHKIAEAFGVLSAVVVCVLLFVKLKT